MKDFSGLYHMAGFYMKIYLKKKERFLINTETGGKEN